MQEGINKKQNKIREEVARKISTDINKGEIRELSKEEKKEFWLDKQAMCEHTD